MDVCLFASKLYVECNNYANKSLKHELFGMSYVVMAFKDLMQSKNTSGYFSFYVDNISLKTYYTWNFSKIPTKSY